MDDYYPRSVFEKKEKERAQRLLKFVQDELRNMWVEVRFDFAQSLLTWLEPEIKEIVRKK